MGVDDYLVKPVTREELTQVVGRLHKIAEYDERLQELTTHKLKRNVLRVEKSQAELEGSGQFQRLQEKIAGIEDRVDELAAELNVEKEDLRL